jgi:starch phosphorylase
MIDTAHLKFKGKFIGRDPEYFYRMGIAYANQTKSKQIALATVSYSTSKELVRGFLQGLVESGKQVAYLGEVSTDMLTFAMYYQNIAAGVILVNDDHDDTKVFAASIYDFDAKPLDAAAINLVINSNKEYIDFNVPPQTYKNYDWSSEYVNYCLRLLTYKQPKLKVVVDCGNAIGTKSVLAVLQAIPELEVIPLHSELNGTYPHHYPNPDYAINTAELRELVISEHADLGISVGVEGTRVRFVDHHGNTVAPHYLAAALSDKLLDTYPNRAIVFDASCSRMFEHKITSRKAICAYCDISEENMIAKMHNSLAVFGFDQQDNYYFASNHGLPSGALAALNVIELVSQKKQKLADIIAAYRKQYHVSDRISLQLQPDKSLADLGAHLAAKYGAEHTHIKNCSITIDYPDWRVYIRTSKQLLDGHTVRMSVEAIEEWLTDHISTELIDYSNGFVTKFDEELYVIDHELANLAPRKRVEELLQNIYYSWNRHSHSPTHPLYSTNWIDNPPALAIIRKMSEEDFAKYWQVNKDWINLQLRQLYIYQNDFTYFEKLSAIHHKLNILHTNPVAYFSMEFGLADWLQIYSGGLGVLAGDTIKQSSDTGLPMVGVGIFYTQGYFHQQVDSEGNQVEIFKDQAIDQHPLSPARDVMGNVAEIEIIIGDHPVYVRAWVLEIGRTDLILLDTNYERNERLEDRLISNNLYGGDRDTRIRQEILLGIGGYQMLRAMGIDPAICHMNEGHSAFVSINIIERIMKEDHLSFEMAHERAKNKLVFTNHTLKPAGNDTFSHELVVKYLQPYADKLGVNFESIYRLGTSEPLTQGQFSMTIAGMNTSKLANAVSIIHSKAAKNIWPLHELKPITNGVHMPTWVARPLHQLMDQYVTEKWHDPYSEVNVSQLWHLPKQELWQTHQSLKQVLVNTINAELGTTLRSDILLFSWFRRFAAYKRPDLIISDINRLLDIVESQHGSPIQILIGGKAHPQDGEGKRMLKNVYQELQRPEFKNRIVFVPGYNWRLAKMLVAGSDVWINTPQRYEEACGTSGMKAAANGVLQFTTLDGWTDEVDWHNIGWVLPDHDPQSFFNIIQNDIIPTYYQREHNGLPRMWIDRMIRTMEVVVEKYSSERQLNDYLKELYLPLLKQS